MRVSKFVTVEPIRFMFSMTIAMQQMVIQELVHRKLLPTEEDGGEMHHYNDSVWMVNPSQSKDISFIDGIDTVRDDTASWCFYLDICTSLLGAVVSSVFGSASDKLGRRGLLILPSIGVISGCLTMLIQSYYLHIPVKYLLISALLTGLFGYSSASFIGTMSYICDITDPSDRSLRLGVMESMGFIGYPLGLFITSTLHQMNQDAVSILLIICIQGVILLFTLVWLEESIEVEPISNIQTKSSFCQRICSDVRWSLRRTLMVYVVWRTKNRRQLLLINQLVGVLSSLGWSGEVDLTNLYTSRPPLSWTTPTLLAYLSIKDVARALMLLAGVPLLFMYISHWTVRMDMEIAITTSLFTSASLVVVAFSSTTAMMMLSTLVGSVGGFPAFLISSIKCKFVEDDEYGAVFACTMLIQTVFRLGGRVLFQVLYKATLPMWPRLPFFGMGIFFVMLLSIITYMWCLSGDVDKKDNERDKWKPISTGDDEEDDDHSWLIPAEPK